MKKLLYIGIVYALISSASCRKFVEIPAENVRELKYTKDYQGLLLNNSGMIGKTYTYPILSSDEVWTDDIRWQNGLNVVLGYAYQWAPKLFGFEEEDGDWSMMYRAMFTLNTVITEVMDSEGGSEQEKRTAHAQALVHRAYLYFTLVNIYAKQYDAATAATDPGVPVLLDNRLFSSLQRKPVAEVYDQIVKDLQEALPLLPDRPDNVTNPSKGAVYSILARVYLHKREFAEAKRNAELTLGLKNSLIDLNLFADSTTYYPTKVNDPECIFSKVENISLQPFPLSNELVDLLGPKDLRYVVYTKPGTEIQASNYTNRGYMRHRIISQGIYTGTSVPEMMLIKAECEARAGNATAAIDVLNSLRKKRFTPADYAGLPVTSADDALREVINERRRELMGSGMRWFDQRRLQKDPSFNFVKSVTRDFKGTTYTLEPGSNRYVFAIADKYIQLNPEIEQNPR